MEGLSQSSRECLQQNPIVRTNYKRCFPEQKGAARVSFFGVEYYPEHWPEARWEEDARLMQEMGITAVRLGEFSWVKFEPREGEYHFEWLDRALDVLYRHGIRAILGTPTAAPPAWLIEAHPEYLPVDSRTIVCPSADGITTVRATRVIVLMCAVW